MHLFQVNFLFIKHFSRYHRISCLAHHLAQTDNTPSSGLIQPRHTSTSRVVVHQNWVAKCSPHLLKFSESIWRQCYIFGLHIPEAIKTVTAMVHYCYCLIVSGKSRSTIWNNKIKITSFIFLSKNV